MSTINAFHAPYPALLFEKRYAAGATSVFDWLLALFLLCVASFQATDYWYVSTYVAYTLPVAFILPFLIRPYATVVRIPAFWAMLCFLVWIYLAALVSPHRELAMAHTWYITKVWLIALLAIASCGTYKQLVLYLKAILLGAFVLALSGAVLGYATVQGGGARVEGLAQQANAFGTSLFHGMLAGIILFAYVGRTWKLIIGLYCGAAFMAMLASGSRGAAFATVVALLIYVWLQYCRQPWRKARAVLPAVIVIIAPVLVAVKMFPDSPLVTRFTELIEGRVGATSGRWDIYRHAWELFLSHPFRGTGMGTFRAYSQYVYTHSTFFDRQGEMPGERSRHYGVLRRHVGPLGRGL